MDIATACDLAWDSAVRAYEGGRVNSESTLQAILYAALTESLPSATVLCEPQLAGEGLGATFPDLVVISGSEVVAAIEIKFVPHYYPRFERDLEKLKRYASFAKPFYLTADPPSGKFSDQQFQFAPGCLLVFGAIGQQDAEAVNRPALEKAMNEFGQRFKALVYPVGQVALTSVAGAV